MINRVKKLSRPTKQVIAATADILFCLLTVHFAYWLRINEWINPSGNRLISYAVAPVLAVTVFMIFGQYRVIFRFTSWATIVALAKAIAVYGAVYAALFSILVVPDVPRSIGIIQPILLLIALTATRVGARSLLDSHRPHSRTSGRRRAIIYGAGSAGRQLEAALERAHEMEVVAFVDDDPALRGGVLHGKKIHGAHDLKALISAYRASDFLLAIPSATRQRRAEIIASVVETGIKIQMVPGVVDIASGRIEINELREPGIEDLLGRDMALPDASLMTRNITGKTVLVTGAGGSIGSELCRQIFSQAPRRLILVEQSEFALYSVHRELEMRTDGSCEIVPLLGSVLNEARMDHIVAGWRPDTIYHAAAYKHVPLVEQNVAEGLLNNAIGTMVMATVAERHQVASFVLISTDKAVRPTNVMGATKRLAEQILQARAAEGSRVCFSMVRFGNVLGSSGSVVPLFTSQIRAGGPVTITHQDITRYFMTIPEASQLVIQAGAMARGGEVFVLDMGEPVKIVDLARRMIELSGLTVRSEERPDGDIEIRTVGLRPGEKLYEELLIGENPEATPHPLIMKAHEAFMPWSSLAPALATIREAASHNDEAIVKTTLKALVPEFVEAPPATLLPNVQAA